jgi:predicted amino acid dehydrogenase
VIGLRGAKLGLSLGRRDGLDFRDISKIATFRLQDPEQEVFGEVIAIPMTPEEMLEHQDIALERMHRVVKWAERDGSKVSAVGLGSLCSIVAKRGRALQEKVSVPVTTGNAATAWTLMQNCLKANPNKEPMSVFGSGSPVGQIVVSYLTENGVSLTIDNLKMATKLGLEYIKEHQKLVKKNSFIIGCGPTGPVLDAAELPSEAIVLDVALPHSFQGKRKDCTVYLAERMSMPSSWKRGRWGALYHLLSGYGYSTILACFVEPLVLTYMGREKSFALGRKLQMEDVLEFGKYSEHLGFLPVLSR